MTAGSPNTEQLTTRTLAAMDESVHAEAPEAESIDAAHARLVRSVGTEVVVLLSVVVVGLVASFWLKNVGVSRWIADGFLFVCLAIVGIRSYLRRELVTDLADSTARVREARSGSGGGYSDGESRFRKWAARAGKEHPRTVVAVFVLVGVVVLVAVNLFVWFSLSESSQAAGKSADGAHATLLVLEFLALAISIPYYAVKAGRMRSWRRTDL